MNNKKIGLDIDDTICNTNFVLMKYAIKYNKEHGNKPMLKYNTNNFGEVFGWSNEEVNDFFRTYYLDALSSYDIDSQMLKPVKIKVDYPQAKALSCELSTDVCYGNAFAINAMAEYNSKKR